MNSTMRDREPEIERIRNSMEALDDELIHLIARRCELSRELGAAKQMRGLPVIDTSREAAVVRRAAERAREVGVDEEAVRHVFWCLIDLSRRSQTDARLAQSPLHHVGARGSHARAESQT